MSSANPTPPDTSRRTIVDVCFEILMAPPTRNESIERLAATFPVDRQASVRQRWQNRTLDGTPVTRATSITLEIEAVGLAGWAKDREHRGEHNLGAGHWLEAAAEALEMWRQLRAA